ncbi:MAG TPA: energy transducer TonB [Opitutus sp.]|nr:energy transducer TonB [Opitutus sp.]
MLALAKSGRTLADACRYVMTVPMEERYVAHAAASTAAQDSPQLRRPRVLRIVRPLYPKALELTHTEGEVLVEFVVDTTGRVRDARVVKTSHPAFGDFAVAAVKQWLFAPASHDGHLVDSRLRVPVQFRLSDIWQPRQRKAASPGEQPPAEIQ